MEQTVHSHSKPDVKPKVPSGKPNNKKSQKQSSDLLTSKGRQQPARNCKNGIMQGFYKLSPKQASSSSPLTVGSPKASKEGLLAQNVNSTFMNGQSC